MNLTTKKNQEPFLIFFYISKASLKYDLKGEPGAWRTRRGVRREKCGREKMAPRISYLN